MRCNRIIGVGLVCALGFTLAGCETDNWVSREESLDTAMSRDQPSSAELYGYVPPDEDRAVDLTPDERSYQTPPRVVILDGGRADDFDADEDFDDRDRVVIAPSDQRNSSFRDFSFDVRHQLEALDRDLAELQARAEIKGAAAEAAVEPAARDLRMYREQIESRLGELQNVEDLSQSTRQQAEIRELLREARRSLNRAEDDINDIPAVD